MVLHYLHLTDILYFLILYNLFTLEISKLFVCWFLFLFLFFGWDPLIFYQQHFSKYSSSSQIINLISRMQLRGIQFQCSWQCSPCRAHGASTYPHSKHYYLLTILLQNPNKHSLAFMPNGQRYIPKFLMDGFIQGCCQKLKFNISKPNLSSLTYTVIFNFSTYFKILNVLHVRRNTHINFSSSFHLIYNW